MRKTGKPIRKPFALVGLFLLGLTSGCSDSFDAPALSPDGHQLVDVRLDIAYAAQENISDTPTKASEIHPDKLYNLEIRQYDLYTGACLNPSAGVISEQETGATFSVPLAQSDACRLVFVAWGATVGTRLGTGTYQSAQTRSVSASNLETIDPADPTSLKNMPYCLCLDPVRVTPGGKIQSPDGQDVRVRLRRLATRLALSWDYQVSGYTLQQILLQSIPTHYKVIPAPDASDGSYPSLLDPFTIRSLSPAEISAGHYACWVPANVRGTNPAATSLLYRTKQTAPIGSSFVNFVAVNTADTKKKIDYRVYLGGTETSDFNLYENHDYQYAMLFNHRQLPVNDKRVTLIDPVPASENNHNLLPTANCFMVSAGSAFCFNPYQFSIAGSTAANEVLQGWCGGPTGTVRIRSVKMLWQTKENGDVGDPVLGIVNSASDHTNIVELADGDSFENARIYCRVASNTLGGSGVIAAYDGADGTGNILWSWHIWVTDYHPSAVGNQSIDEALVRKQKYTYGNHGDLYPMMDRNLGAKAGYTDVPPSELEKSKTNGFHYQWGRKDPFPSSYSEVQIGSLKILIDQPTTGMMNLYKPDGYSFFERGSNDGNVGLQEVYRHPTTVYSNGDYWTRQVTQTQWDESNAKTVHDPCPAGWRVAGKNNYLPLFNDANYSGSSGNTGKIALNIKNSGTLATDGGGVLYFESTASSGRSSYFRLTGYQDYSTSFIRIGTLGNLWCREAGDVSHGYALTLQSSLVANLAGNWAMRDAHPVRCVQENP